jgi:hypothetical protein
VKVKIEKPDRVVNEKGEHVGTVMSKGFRKNEIYCFLCNKIVSGLKYYEEHRERTDEIVRN